MKKLVLALLVLAFFGFAIAEEKYEITEVDIFSLEKPPSSAQVSVYGVSLGDTMEEALRKTGKKPSDVRKGRAYYSLDVTDFTKTFTIDFSLNSKVVVSIRTGENFSDKLKGKTDEYFKRISDDRFWSIVEGCFGKPDFIHQVDVLKTYMLFYLEGFVFERMFSDNSMILTTEENVIFRAETFKAKKVGEIEKEIPRPKISTTGFRKVMWGMSAEQAKEIETAEFVKRVKGGGDFKGLDILFYTSNISGLDCAVVYYFADNMLTRARYLITEEHANENLYIEDFVKIKNQLVEKYGSPDRDDTIWSNDLYQDDPSEYGMAVSVGHLMYVAEWYPPETIIQLLLRGDNYNVSLWVEYIGEDFREFEKKIRKKAQEDIW